MSEEKPVVPEMDDKQAAAVHEQVKVLPTWAVAAFLVGITMRKAGGRVTVRMEDDEGVTLSASAESFDTLAGMFTERLNRDAEE